MNEVYFVCFTCKTYHDAGYRWCSAHLEYPGIVRCSEPVFVEAVFDADEYWKGVELQEEQAQWLHDALPSIKKFLEKHRNHNLSYEVAENFLWNDEELDWMDEEDAEYPDMSPRFFVERLDYIDWQRVVEYVEKVEKTIGLEPDWWFEPTKREKAKRKFEELARRSA